MPSSIAWHARLFDAVSSVLGLMLAVALLALTNLSCTIERVILYNTETPPPPVKATPQAKIGPS